MFRVLGRELMISLAALTALAVAAVALAFAVGGPTFPDWHTVWSEMAGDPSRWTGHLAALGAALRLACFALLALLATLIILRILVAGLLLRLDYAVLAHLAVAFRLPMMQRAGATAVVGLILAPLSTAVAAGSPARRAIISSVRSAAPRRAAEERTDATVPRRRTRSRGHPPTRLLRRVGPALRYTVQPGDTLTLIADKLCGDPQQYQAIFLASRVLRQPDGQYLTNPNLIYPGWTLLVPLSLVKTVARSGDAVVYVVQRGDSLSAIAARFLGDWRRYPDLQPQGTIITDDNLIYPGLVVRLPAAAVVVPYHAPVQLHRTWPRRPAYRRAEPCDSGSTLHPAPVLTHRGRTRTLTAVQPRRRADTHPARRPAHPRRGRRIVVRPRQHEHPRHHRVRRRQPPTAIPTRVPSPRPTSVPTRVPSPRAPSVMPSSSPTVLAAPTHLATPRPRPTPVAGPQPLPVVRLPDTERVLPLALLLALVPVLTLVALKRRGGTTPATAHGPAHAPRRPPGAIDASGRRGGCAAE